MLIIRKFLKSIAGRTKGSHGLHAARGFETPGLHGHITRTISLELHLWMLCESCQVRRSPTVLLLPYMGVLFLYFF